MIDQRLLSSLDITSLQSKRSLGMLSGLPGRGTNVRNAIGIGEDVVDFLERFTGSLREEEEGVDKHGSAEDTEDDVRLPADIGKSHGGEQTQSSVEGPVTRRGQRHSLTTHTQRVQLRRVHPRHRTPGDGVRGDEEVSRRNETLGRGTTQTHRHLRSAADTSWDDYTVRCHDTCVRIHPDHHERRTNQERRPTAPAVHPDQGWDGHEHVDDILNRRRNQVRVTAVAGHFEHVGNIVHFFCPG